MHCVCTRMRAHANEHTQMSPIRSLLLLLSPPLPRVPALTAPEVHRKEPYNEKADVFSFGILMYQMFARTVLAIEMKNGPYHITNAGEMRQEEEPERGAG